MNEKLKSYWEKGKDTVGSIAKIVWIVAAVVLVLVALGITIFLNTRPWSTLIVSTDQSEISAVLSWLDEQGYTNYRLAGNAISVPADQAIRLKTALLKEGYPKQGYSYDNYFNNIGMLSTESERVNAARIDLQEKLASVFSGLEGIESATVDIALGQDRSYILSKDDVINATVAVKVVTRNGEPLSAETAEGIRQYASHAVQGIVVDSVSIIDQYGNPYYPGVDSTGSVADASALKLLLQAECENRARAAVMQILTPFYGEGNVYATVNCTVDVNTREVDKYEVDLPENAVWTGSGGAGIIGERRYMYTVLTENGANPGGTVGTATNSDLPEANFPTYPERDPDMSNDPDRMSGEGELIYDNSKTQTHWYINSAEVIDCHVAVSINSTTAGAVDLTTIRNHVAQAAGINAVVTEEMTAAQYLESKISVVSGPFYNSVAPGGQDGEPGLIPGLNIPNWVLIAAAAGLLLFIILLMVILMARGRKRKKALAVAEQQMKEQQEITQIIQLIEPEAEPKGADVMELQTERSMALRQDIRQFAEENPEVAAQLLRTWLRGGDDNG